MPVTMSDATWDAMTEEQQNEAVEWREIYIDHSTVSAFTTNKRVGKEAITLYQKNYNDCWIVKGTIEWYINLLKKHGLWEEAPQAPSITDDTKPIYAKPYHDEKNDSPF